MFSFVFKQETTMTFFRKLKSALSGTPIDPEQLDENFIQSIIDTVENEVFALSDRNVLYAGLTQLAGYHYVKTIVIGTLHFKTIKGAKLRITGRNFEFDLNSDMLEIESEDTPIAHQSLTHFDFEISEDQIEHMKRSEINKVQLILQKQTIDFKVTPGKTINVAPVEANAVDTETEETETEVTSELNS